MRKDLHEANRLSWNAATQAHNSHKIDQAGFLRRGGSTLFAEELALLGDVRGLRIAHLQCNAGQDSLSLAALGALVTGVDISDEAIAFARRLSTDSGIAANFTRADIYDWLEREAAENPASYDIAFSSYGFLCWLSDLTVWAKGIHAILKPGGRFAAVEFHPFAMCFDQDWEPVYDYGGGNPIREDDGVSDYVGLSGDALAPSGFAGGEQRFRQSASVSRILSWSGGNGECSAWCGLCAAKSYGVSLRQWLGTFCRNASWRRRTCAAQASARSMERPPPSPACRSCSRWKRKN